MRNVAIIGPLAIGGRIDAHEVIADGRQLGIVAGAAGVWRMARHAAAGGAVTREAPPADDPRVVTPARELRHIQGVARKLRRELRNADGSPVVVAGVGPALATALARMGDLAYGVAAIDGIGSYLNRGDPYRPTVIVDRHGGGGWRVRVAAWGDLVERADG